MISWETVFTRDGLPWKNARTFNDCVFLKDLDSLRRMLDAVHVRYCLVKPYQDQPSRYPLVEARELLPSFDSDLWEYKSLPGFAMVAFARPLEYFSEIFQYDILHPVINSLDAAGATCPLEGPVIDRNVKTIAARLPRVMQDAFQQQFGRVDTAVLDYYPALMPYLLQLDRAHVMATDATGHFHLAGIFASFPSDIDSELKRFGMRIGKFKPGDNAMYERNRMFVYQFLMELYGFPIVSERRTSSALFARKLHRMGERFLLRVLGQTDRCITTYTHDDTSGRYPELDKMALVAIDDDQHELIRAIEDAGYFLDRKKRVIILRVRYRQHDYDAKNVRQERALSVAAQEVLHPLTGAPLCGLNVIRDSNNMFLRLNDIVRGEYTGSIVYKRTEIVEKTDTDEKRLKFLYSWLTKHQRRMIGYSDEFFAKIHDILSTYLHAPEHDQAFEAHREVYGEVLNRFSYIQQARKVRVLEDLRQRVLRGNRIGYRVMMRECVQTLTDLKFEIVAYFPDLVDAAIGITEKILADRYLVHKYIGNFDETLSPAGAEIRKNYGRIVSLLDGLIAVRKARSSS